MSQVAIIGGLVLMICCSSSSAMLMMGGGDSGPTSSSGSTSSTWSSTGSTGTADGTPCDSGIAGRDNHYMNGECVYKGCSPGYSDVNGTCISARWYLPGGVGPHYRKYLSKKPSASCQANGEWKILDSGYFDKKLNCADTDCLDDGSYNFCFKRQSENVCNSSASGYYGRNPEERTLMEDGGRDDRVKDCVWVASLPPSKVFNSEAEYASVGSSGGSDSAPVPLDLTGLISTKPAKLSLWGGPNCTGEVLKSRGFLTNNGFPLKQQWDMESNGNTVCCAEVENMKIHSATVGGDMFNVTDKEYSDNVKLDFGGCSDDVKFTFSLLE